jgi:hypothetical protein
MAKDVAELKRPLGQSRHLNGALGVSAIAPIATKMV